MPQPRRKGPKTLPDVKGRQRPVQTPQATSDPGFRSRLKRAETIGEAIRTMSPAASDLMVWMVQSGAMEQKSEPYITAMSVKDLSSDVGVSPQVIVDCLEEIGDYLVPVNDNGMTMRPVTLLGIIGGDNGPEVAILYLVPAYRSEGTHVER